VSHPNDNSFLSGHKGIINNVRNGSAVEYDKFGEETGVLEWEQLPNNTYKTELEWG